jgi:hypothetical protein
LGFNDALNSLAATLGADPGIAAFCSATFNGATLTVQRVFQDATEISLSQLPIMLMTRPHVTEGRYWNGVGEFTHLVRLYVLFHEPVIANVQDDLVYFDEVVEAAILSYRNAGQFPAGVLDIRPGSSTNDEGKRNADNNYKFVKEVEIDERRDTTVPVTD